MEFTIKTYKVPVKREGDQVTHKEVKLDENNFVKEETIEIEHSFQIPPQANKIKSYNEKMLTMAKLDKNIAQVSKQVLCRPNRDFVS